jgi:hypothetical protein
MRDMAAEMKEKREKQRLLDEAALTSGGVTPQSDRDVTGPSAGTAVNNSSTSMTSGAPSNKSNAGVEHGDFHALSKALSGEAGTDPDKYARKIKAQYNTVYQLKAVYSN